MQRQVAQLLLLWLCTAPSHVSMEALTDACQFGQSPEDGCAYECHCKHQITCDMVNGSCGYGGCTEFYREGYRYWSSWSGPGCQIGDALAGGRAINGPEAVTNATLALDGNSHPNESCAVSRADDGTPAWWLGDLGAMYLISHVVVQSTSDTSYLSYTRIEISPTLEEADYQLCDDINLLRYAGEDFVQCQASLLGRYIRLVRHEAALFTWELRVCEINAVGFRIQDCSDFYYGPGCLMSCDCPCDDVTGDCLSFVSGYPHEDLETSTVLPQGVPSQPHTEESIPAATGGPQLGPTGNEEVPILQSSDLPAWGVAILVVGMLAILVIGVSALLRNRNRKTDPEAEPAIQDVSSKQSLTPDQPIRVDIDTTA